MPPRLRHLLAILALAAPGLCAAGGTIDFSTVDHLLRQQPAVHAWLSSTLALPDTVFAEVRFGPHFKHLSGARMGPYTFKSKPKTSSAAGDVEVIVCTDASFLDDSGKRLPESEMEDAVRLEETLASVQVRDWRGDAGSPDCPK